MRLEQVTDGRSHDALAVAQDQHHARPEQVSFSNNSQSLPPGTTYDLDVSLPSSGFSAARVMLRGPAPSGVGTALWKESAMVHVTTSSSQAIGHSVRSTGSTYKTYDATYTKSVGDQNLTHKIFNPSTGSHYIALQDAWIVGSVLRLRFKNHHGGSVTLNVDGHAQLY
jgi:hypothetical protein